MNENWDENGFATAALRERLKASWPDVLLEWFEKSCVAYEQKKDLSSWSEFEEVKSYIVESFPDETKPVRRTIPKSVRFEVFKRDTFTCQYCGAKAPEVVLHVDHLKPVAAGGGNDLLNLVTACEGCNLGKSDRLISDQSILSRQRDQLEALNERRQQLEMLLEWRRELSNIEDECVAAVQSALEVNSGLSANEFGVRDIRRWLKRFSLADVLVALDTSFTQYLRGDEYGPAFSKSWNKAFDMIPRIAAVNSRGGLPENLRKAFYARGILRRRCPYLQESDVMPLMRRAMEAGLSPDDLIAFAKTVSSWSEFEEIMDIWISGS